VVQTKNQMKVCGEAVSSTAELRQRCASWLRESCDGSGLREVASSKRSSHWVSAGADAIPDTDYVHYHHVRINCLPSRARVSRDGGKQALSDRMSRYRDSGSLCAALLQNAGGRILRHNDLCRQVGGFLKQKGWRVDEESYSTKDGRRKPDLTVAKGGDAVVIDAQVVSGETALSTAHKRKVEKYQSCEKI